MLVAMSFVAAFALDGTSRFFRSCARRPGLGAKFSPVSGPSHIAVETKPRHLGLIPAHATGGEGRERASATGDSRK